MLNSSNTNPEIRHLTVENFDSVIQLRVCDDQASFVGPPCALHRSVQEKPKRVSPLKYMSQA